MVHSLVGSIVEQLTESGLQEGLKLMSTLHLQAQLAGRMPGAAGARHPAPAGL